MKRNNLTAIVLAAVMALLPFNSSALLPKPKPQPPQETVWVAGCIVIGAAAAITGIILVARKCRPKYYCMRDSEDPPNYFVGTATDKECEINGWQRVNGPYDSAGDVPDCNANTPTNITQQASSPVRLQLQASTNLQDWSTIHEEVCELDAFSYTITNGSPTMFYRFKQGPP